MTATLLEALAHHAAAGGHGAYRVGAPYRDDEVAITFSAMPAAPRRTLVLTPYEAGGEPDSRHPWTEPYVQARLRGFADEHESATRAQALWSDWHGTTDLALPGDVYVMSIIAVHHGPVSLGRDEAGDYSHAVSFRIECLDGTRARPTRP